MSNKAKKILSALLMLAVALQPARAQNTGLFDEWTETDYSEYEITHEYFTSSGTAPSASGGYDMTGYIPVKEGDVIVFSGDRSPGIPFMMGYTDNEGHGATVLLGNFDADSWDGLQVMDEEVLIPAGTAYVRCCARNTSLPQWASRNMSVIKRSLADDPRVVRILCIGNSFSADAVESWLSPMARESGIQLIIGNAVRGGWGLYGHWTDISEGNAETEYRKIVGGTYSLTSGHTLTEIINDEPWDIITFQQNSQDAGIYSTYSPYLEYLIGYVRGMHPQARLGWLMPWAYAKDAEHGGFANYNHDQMTMYNAIVDAAVQVMRDHPDLKFLIPCGTAIQNLRTSIIGDNVNRDGVHLDLKIGRLTAAYTVFATLFGEEATIQNTYHPLNQLSEDTLMMARQAALDAVRNPFAVTPQAYNMDFTLKGDDRLVVGDSLSVSSTGDLSQYTFKWTRGDALGTFEYTAISTTKDYVIKESDYEQWLRVTVCDNAGDTLFAKDTWISKLPVLYINTDDGKPITSKTNYVTASLRIQGNSDYEQQYFGSTEIKGRGTTSWDQYPQKPYKLKLDRKTKLFGFGKSKHWVLISNFNDKSCLRNYTASRLAKQLGVLGMDMTWVDVVLNGEVMGCYMLSQHIRPNKNSVDIFDWEGEAEDIADTLFNVIKDADALAEEDKELLEQTMKQNLSWVTDGRVTFKGKTYNLSGYGLKKEYDITEGYLFEASAKQDGHTQFTTPQSVHFEVSHPEYLSTNSEMFSYVTEFWKDFEAEYCQVPAPCKNFSKYANMESMVGVWLVNEFMGQGDPTNSRYSYIADDGKLHFGPVWDFDHGGGSWSTIRDVNFFYTLIHKLDYTYYKKWFPDPFLCQMAYDAYWNVARPFMMDYLSEGGEMDAKYALFAKAGKTNDVLWGSYPSRLNPSAEPRTTIEDVEILRTFLLNHIKWLDVYFKSVETLIEVMNTYCPYPCDPDLVNVKGVTADRQTGIQKVIKNNHLYIMKDNETYSVDGKRIK